MLSTVFHASSHSISSIPQEEFDLALREARALSEVSWLKIEACPTVFLGQLAVYFGVCIQSSLSGCNSYATIYHLDWTQDATTSALESADRPSAPDVSAIYWGEEDMVKSDMSLCHMLQSTFFWV